MNTQKLPIAEIKRLLPQIQESIEKVYKPHKCIDLEISHLPDEEEAFSIKWNFRLTKDSKILTLYHQVHYIDFEHCYVMFLANIFDFQCVNEYLKMFDTSLDR